MNLPYLVKQLGLAALLVFCLVSCSQCNEDNKATSTSKPQARIITGDTPQDSLAQPQRTIQNTPEIQNKAFEEQENESLQLFEAAYEKNPKDPDTWMFFMRLCGLKAQADKPDAMKCYDRFFKETKDLAMNEDTMTTALRWRIIMALQEDNGPEAKFYWVRLASIEKEMVKQGKLPKEIIAYSAFIHSGVLFLEDKREEAIAELQMAVQLYEESGTDDPEILLDYLEKLAQFQSASSKHIDAIKTLEKQEKILIKKYGNINPMVAVCRLKRISILLTIDDKHGASELWDYVYNVIGRFKKDELPPEINDLYVQTMVRLDAAGVLP